jgi:hypothetical protein
LIGALGTFFSWFVLGIWYGFGYCFCTDWHWQVREALGRPVESHSYVHFLLLELTGIDFPSGLLDTTVVVVFALALLLSVVLNLRDRYRGSRSTSSHTASVGRRRRSRLRRALSGHRFPPREKTAG